MVKNFHLLVLKFDLDQSEHKSSQSNTRKTYVFLRLHLARAFGFYIIVLHVRVLTLFLLIFNELIPILIVISISTCMYIKHATNCVSFHQQPF